MARRKALAPKDMSPAQLECYRLWCDFKGGESHVIEHVSRWGEGIRCSARNLTLATFDFCALTRLVVLSHDRAIRAEVMSAGMELAVALHKRSREGAYCERHPDLDTNVAIIRGYLAAQPPNYVHGVDPWPITPRR